MLVLPLLTRLYTASDFGVLALFTTITGVTSVVATARYEFAVMLPQTERRAFSVVALSVATACLLGALAFAAAILWSRPIAMFLGNPAFAPWLFVVPLSIVLNGAFQALSYFVNRRKRFGLLAASKIAQTLTAGGTNVVAGFVSPSPTGLIGGNVAGVAAATGTLAIRTRARSRRYIRSLSMSELVSVAREYSDFPRFYAPGALCDNASAALPIIVLNRVYDVALSGYFGLTTRIIAGPAGIISTSVGQVLFQRLVEANNAGHRLTPLIVQAAKRLALVALIPLIVVTVAGPWLFAVVFGAKWVFAGQIARIMAAAFAIRFVVSPLSITFTVLNRVKLGSAWQAAYLASTAGVLSNATVLPVRQLLGWLTVNEVLAYTLYFLLILKAARDSEVHNECVGLQGWSTGQARAPSMPSCGWHSSTPSWSRR